MIDAKALRKMLAKASRKELYQYGQNVMDAPPLRYVGDDFDKHVIAEGASDENAALIVAAVNALPELLDENERLHRALEDADEEGVLTAFLSEREQNESLRAQLAAEREKVACLRNAIRYAISDGDVAPRAERCLRIAVVATEAADGE